MNCVITGVSANNDTADNKLKKIAADVAKSLDGAKKTENIIMSLLNNNENYHLIEYIRTRLSDKDIIKQYTEEVNLEEGKFTANDYIKINSNTLTRLLKAYYKEVIPSVENSKTNKAEGSLNGFLTGSAKTVALNHTADLIKDEYFMNQFDGKRVNRYDVLKTVNNKILNQFYTRVDNYVEEIINPNNTNYKENAKEDIDAYINIREKIKEHKNQIRNIDTEVETIKGDIKNKQKAIQELINTAKEFVKNNDQTNAKRIKLQIDTYKKDIEELISNLKELYSKRDKLDIKISIFNIDKYTAASKLINNHINDYIGVQKERIINYMNLVNQTRYNANEWYNQVYHNKSMTSILKQTEITEDIDEYLAGEDPGKDELIDTANQENLDETSRSWEDSLYKSFDNAVSGKLKLLIGQLYNLSDKYNENTTEQALDTDNELGVATRMNVQKVINNIFSFADCSNVESFINSIEHKSNTIYSLYGLNSLVHQMKQYRDLANFVFVNFSKPIVHKTMLTVSNIADKNGIKFDYTNTTAFYKTANIFNLANSLRNTYNDIITKDIDYFIKHTFGMFEINKNINNLTEGVYNILKEFFPHIDKKAIIDAVININNDGNIEQLKGCINTLNRSVQKYKEQNNEEYVKIINANRKVLESIKLAIEAKRAEYNSATVVTDNGTIKSKYSQAAIDNAMKKFEAELRQEKESEYKDPSEIGVDLSSAIYSSLYALNELIGDYIESSAKLNTSNAEGNSASDVVKNCFITRLFDKINGTFATKESKESTVDYFTQGIANGTQNQYANNPLLFGLKDINGVIQVPGLIDKTKTGFTINNNTAKGFTYSLFDGSKNSNTQNGKGYSKMSKFDFFITQFNAFKYGINEFDETGYNDTINGVPNAVYSMRIGSDAPKIYFIRAPKYNISQAKLAIYNHVLDELNMFISGLNSIFVEDGTQYVLTNDVTNLYDRLHYSDSEAKKLKAKGKTDLTSAFIKDGKLVGKAFNFYRLHEVSDTNNKYKINEMMDELLSLYGGVDDHALFNIDVNGRFNLIPNNSIVHNGDKFELVLSQEQKEKLFNFVDKWCDAYLREEEQKLAEFLQIFKDNNIEYTFDDIDSYLLNTLNMNMNYDDLFEGDYKFYNKSRDFLKRTKESQAGGDSFAGYDITKNQTDIIEDNEHNIEIETGTLNSDGTKSRNPIIINGKILKPRNGFKAITIYNTVSKSDVADDMQKQLYDDFIKQGDSHEKAYEKSVNITKGFGFDNGDLTKTNDAQSYITFDEWIRRRFADGTISEYKDIISQLFDDNISIDQIDLSKVNARIQVDKNFYFDKVYDAETNMFVPRQIKNAEFVLIPKLLPTGSDLRKVYDFMVKHDIGQLNTAETSKAAKKNIFTIWGDNGEFTDNFKNMFDENGTIKNEDGFDNNYIENYYYQYLYKQQDVPEHIMNESNKAGSQIIKKILDNIIKGLKEDTQHSTDLQQRLHNFENAYAINIKKSVESFCDMMGWKYNHDTNTVTNLDGSENLDYSKFLERMREEGARLGMDSNFFDYCTDNGYGDTIMPNFMNINMSKLESIAQACFNRVITRQKLPGWHAAQITGVGYSNKLHFDVETGTMEVYLPRWSSKIPKYDSTNPQHIRMVKEAKANEEYSKLRDYEIFDKLLIKQLNDKQLDLHIGYRIPTEGKQSIANLKVVGFVNEAFGSTIVVPNDWVTLTGSDFDADSVYGISWELIETKDKNGNVVLDRIPFEENKVDKKRLYIDYVINKTKDRHLTNVKSIIDSAVSDIKQEYNNEFHEKLNKSNKAFAELNNLRNELYYEFPELIQAKIKKYNSARQFNKNNKTDIYSLYTTIATNLHELTLKPNFTKLFNEEERNNINVYIDILNAILDLLDDREETPIKFDAEHYVSDVKDKIQEIKEQVQAERLKAIEQDAIANGMLSYQDFLKLDFLEQLGQRARNNFILDQMIGIMRDFSSREEQLGRSNFEKITNNKDGANDIISKLANEQGLFRTPYNVTDQLDYFDDVMGGARLKALSVVADNFCSRNNKIRAAFGEAKIKILLENDVEEGAVVYNIDDIIKSYDYDVADYTISQTNISNTSNVQNKYAIAGKFKIFNARCLGWSNTNKNLVDMYITTYTSQTTAHHLDAVKMGSIPNVNEYTFFVYKLFSMMGVDYENAIAFIRQPIITQLVKNYNLINSIFFNNNTQNPFNITIAELAQSLNLTFKYNEKSKPQPITKDTSLYNVITALKNNTEFTEAFYDVFNIDISDTEVKDILKLNIPLSRKQMFTRIKNSKDTDIYAKAFDFGMLLNFNQYQLTANHVNKLIRMTGVEKTGAAQTINENREIIRNIEDYIEKYDKSDEEIREEITSKKINTLQKKWDKAGINKTVTKDDIQEVTDTDISEERRRILKNTLSINNKSIISSIFTANPQDSTYKSLDSVFQYATVLSNKVNTNLFSLERPEMILIKGAIEQVLGKKLSKDAYKKYKKYFVNYLYQNAETKINTPVTVDSRGRILIDQDTINKNNQKDTDYNSEKIRILGVGITTSGDINLSDINNPTKKDIQRFNKLTPAQKVLFIQKHFTENSGIFNYLNVTLLSRKKSLTDRVGRQYISYNDQINNIEDLYYLFRSSFYNHNPLIKLATIDLIKYAFIGEGFDFKTNYISKIIPNDVLYNSIDNGGLGVIDEFKAQLEIFKNDLIKQRKADVLFEGNNTFNTFVDRFIRMNSHLVPKCTFNYNPYMDKFIKDMSTSSGIILIDGRSQNNQNASIFINRTGAYQETPNGFVGNHYIEISFQHKYIKDKKEAYFTKTTLYKIVKSSVDGCYFYIPMNKLNSYEYDENSYNSYNNKQFALNDLIEEVREDEKIFINNHANNFITSIKDIKHSPVGILTNDTVHINNDNIQALNQISNDVNRYIAGGAIKMIDEIKEAIEACYFYNKQGTIYLINNNNAFINRFDENCDQLIYDDNGNEYIAHIEKLQDITAIAQYIQQLFNENGIEQLNPETQHDAEKRFHFIENEIANDTPLFNSNYFKVSLIQDTNAEEARKADTELLTDEAVAPNISEDIIENITTTAPVDILSSSIINEIKYIANRYDDSAANYFMKGITRSRINTDSRFSLKENRANIYKFAARYYLTAANGIINKLNHFKINGKEYFMDSTDFYKALIDNDEYFPEVSRIILDGITFGERISNIFNLDLSVEDEETKKNIESIISSINKVRQNTKLRKAITKIFDVYMKKYATNPEIQEGILKLRETFGDTATFDKWIMDPAEINSAQVQTVMKHINSIFAKAELFDTKRNVEEFTKALDEIKKEQANIDFNKFIDSKTGKFKEDYTQQFIDDRNKLNKAVAVARENRYNSIQDYGKYLKAKLARDKFYNKYTIQEITGDYYEKLNKLTENAIANGGDYFAEYLMLNEQLYDENLTKTETEEQTINRKKLIQQRLQELKTQNDTKSEKANKAAVWIKGYYKNKAKFRKEYYDETVDDSFADTYNQYNKFIKEYNAKHPDKSLEDKLADSDYKEAYNWIKTNGYLSFEDDAMEQINNAFEKLISVKRRNTGNYLATIKRKKDIYDRYGRIDPRKLDSHDIEEIKKEEETSDSLIYATGIGEGHLIKATNKRGYIMKTKKINPKFKKYIDAKKYADVAKQYDLIKKINNIIGKVIDKDTGRFNIAALANNDIVTSEERIALKNYYRELKAIRYALEKNTKEHYKKNKDSSPFTDEIDEEAYNDAMTYYRNNLMNTKEGAEILNIITEIDNKGNIAPNFNLFGYTTILDEDLIDFDKTEAIKFINNNITYDTTDYYEDAKRDALSKGTEYFNKWYEANHIYDSFLHRYRLLHIWTRMAAVPGSELDNKTKYNPSWTNIETFVKEKYKNPDYNEEDNNYKPGNGFYDANLNLTPAETKAKKLFKDTLNKYAYTYQGKRFFKKGYLPRERKQEIDAMWAAKQAGALFGLSWHSNTESDNYKTNIGYIYDKEAEQPMLSLLKTKGVKQLQKYPDSTKYNTKEEYQEAYNKVLKENQEIQKENEALDNAILNRDWEEVMKHFIHNATIYNSRQSAKPYLYLLMEDLKNNDAYKLKGIINKSPIKNRELSTDDNEQFQTEKQTNTEFLITNFARRVLYNQYHQNSPIRSVANFLQNLTSAKYMVFNLYGGIANVTTGKVNIAMEEFAGEYFGFKDIKKAEAAYVEAMPSIIANMYSETAGNITDAFIKEFNVVDFDSILQLPEGANEIDKYLKRARNFTYSFQSMGEHYMQNTVLLAMLNTNKLYLDSNGNMRIGDFKDYTVEIEKQAMENAIKNDANLLNLYKTYRDSIKNNIKEKYEIITKNKDINRNFLNKIKNSDSYKSFYKDIVKKYNAERKNLLDEAKVKFAKNKTVKDLFEFKNGKLNITNEAKTYFDNTVGKDKKNRTGSLEKLIGEFKEKVIFVNKKIHGVYDKNGAASIENSWWGSLVMQYHKHLYTGFMKRWRRRGYYSEMRGSYEYGAYQTFINFLTTDFNGISDRINDAKKNGTNVCLASIQQAMISGLNCILNLQTNYENLSEFEKDNLRRCLGDAAGVLCAVLFVMLLYAGWDDDELKDDGFKSSLLYLADRLYSETVMYSPTGAISEYKTTWSSPIASANGPSDFLKACVLIPQALFDPNYNPEYSTGQYVHKNKLMVLLRRNIPGIRPYDRIDLITKNNKYYKVGASSNIGVNIGRHLGESIND